jgi:hypothetical protein
MEENIQFNTGAYKLIQESRKKILIKYLDKSFFIGKTLHEIGCGYAFYGSLFSLYCNVTVSDARAEHIEEVKRLNPLLKAYVLDVDGKFEMENVDILIHFGVFYHLRKLKEHFESLKGKCKYIILDGQVLDSDKEETIYVTESPTYDQSYNKVGNRSSQKLIESYLTKNGYNFKCIDNDPVLNVPGFNYTWKNLNTRKNYLSGDSARRFWICWAENEKCPIVENISI